MKHHEPRLSSRKVARHRLVGRLASAPEPIRSVCQGGLVTLCKWEGTITHARVILQTPSLAEEGKKTKRGKDTFIHRERKNIKLRTLLACFVPLSNNVFCVFFKPRLELTAEVLSLCCCCCFFNSRLRFSFLKTTTTTL